MNELLDAAQKFGPVVVAVLVPPLVGGVLIPLMGLRTGPRDPAAIRSMARHAKLHDALPETAREPIQKLIEFSAAKYARTMMRRGRRKFQGTNFVALLLIAGMIGFAEYLLIAVAIVWWPAYLLAGALGGFGGALLAAGARQVFAYDEGHALAPAPELPSVGINDEGNHAVMLTQLSDVH